MLSGILQVGRNALIAHRAALHVVGHNLANAQTPGYVRQRPVLAAVPGALHGSPDGAALGAGTVLMDVQRLSDALLSAQIERAEAQGGFFTARHQALAQVESLFTDLEGGGLSQALGDFFRAFTQLSADPGSLGARSETLQRAEILVDSLRRHAEELHGMRTRFNEQLVRQVGEVNRRVEELAALNLQTSQVESAGARADLAGRQDVLLEELARLVGAEAIRYDNGTVDLVVGGQRLVQGTLTQTLRAEADPALPGRARIVFDSTGEPAPVQGEMAGLREVRDGYLDRYLEGLDTLARTLADAVNAQHRLGHNLHGQPGGPLFSYDGVQAARSLAVAGAGLKHALPAGAATDYLAAAAIPLGELVGGAGAGEMRINGVAVSLDPATDTLESLAARINATVPGVTASVTSAQIGGQTRYRLEVVGAQGQPSLTEGGGMLERLGLLWAGAQGRPEALAAGAGPEPGDGNNALALAALRHERILRGGEVSLEEYWADYLVEIGSETAGARDLAAAVDSVSRSLQGQYQAQTGVNLDEEGIELMRYQQAYQAAARVVTTALEMFDTMLEIGRR